MLNQSRHQIRRSQTQAFSIKWGQHQSSSKCRVLCYNNSHHLAVAPLINLNRLLPSQARVLPLFCQNLKKLPQKSMQFIRKLMAWVQIFIKSRKHTKTCWKVSLERLIVIFCYTKNLPHGQFLPSTLSPLLLCVMYRLVSEHGVLRSSSSSPLLSSVFCLLCSLHTTDSRNFLCVFCVLVLCCI